MLKALVLATAGLGAFVVGGTAVAARPQTAKVPNHVSVTLKDVQGHNVGRVEITARKGKNVVDVRASNLTPGFHGFHIHAVGLCDPSGPKPFASAGAHFNPTGQPEGMQAGALPVLLAGATGTAQTRFVDTNFAIKDLFGPTGASIVVHASPDNFGNVPPRYVAAGQPGPDMETQMTGDSGARVACGVIKPPAAGSVPPPAAPSGSVPPPAAPSGSVPPSVAPSGPPMQHP